MLGEDARRPRKRSAAVYHVSCDSPEQSRRRATDIAPLQPQLWRELALHSLGEYLAHSANRRALITLGGTRGPTPARPLPVHRDRAFGERQDDAAVLDRDRVLRERLFRGRIERLARLQVEPREMQRAGQ